ncbi:MULTISPECIES: Arc family DNA-binding protein [Bacillaceae]|uniref:Arc family DNA-binding protein n=1 Tax=Bacillaceae TaxID=186817 RepID=UPI000A894C36|nr:Arc family DNA-binding protein [Bacillus sp. FJAT-27916]
MTKRKAYPLRIDPKLYDALEKWAEDELRSVNAQIEIILKDAVKKAGRLKNEDHKQ